MPRVKSKPSPAETPPPSLPAVLAITHHIDLDPIDWFWAPWRRCAPLPLPVPPAFDFADCAARLARVQVGRRSWRWEWQRAAIAPSLSPEEARFWFEAFLLSREHNQAHTLTEALQGLPWHRPLDRPAIVRRLQENLHALRPEIVPALAQLLSAREVVELMLGNELVAAGPSPLQDAPRYARGVLRDGFRRYLLPYLNGAQREQLRGVVRGRLDLGSWPVDRQPVPVVFALAATLGMHAELLPLVEQWPDAPASRRAFVFQNNERQNVVFGLDGATQVALHLRRLRLRPLSGEHARAWLAHLGLDALEWIHDTITTIPKAEQAAGVLEALCLVKAPEAAPFMLDLQRHSGVPRLARRWLDEQVGNAVAGLVPVAAGHGKKADAARDFLAEVQQRGHTDLIEEQLSHLPAASARKLRRDLMARAPLHGEPLGPGQTPPWLREALAEMGPTTQRLPDWLDVTRLPPLVVANRRLNDAQVQATLAALRQSTLANPHPLIAAVRQHVERASRDAFAWKLFESWLGEGMPAAGAWALSAVGLLGGDEAAAKLLPLLGARQDRQALRWTMTGLECLAAIGSDVALVPLQRIARDPASRGLRARAGELLEAVAAGRGLSREQLEDRILPGFEQGRGRVLDFGRRQFHLVLAADLKPRVQDAGGKVEAQLPKPTAREARQAGAAVREWELLRQHLRTAARVQTQRLQEAMIDCRRWEAAEFEELLGHPLLAHLARRVVWGGFDHQGRLVWSFRVREEGYCASLEDEPCPVDEVETIGIVHPVHLAEEERLAWCELFRTEEVVEPFPQLTRPLQRLPAGREGETEITWFAELGIPSAFLWRLLPKQDYRRSGYQDGLAGWAYVKAFPGAGLTAVLELDGTGSLNSRSGREEFLRLCRAYFVSGLPGRGQRLGEAQELARVDPVVLSEVLSDLHTLAAKGQAIPASPLARPRAATWQPVLAGGHEEPAEPGTADDWGDEIPF